MPKLDWETLRRVRVALRLYEQEVERSPLTLQSKATYILHADQFVRWLGDDFEPGEKVRRSAR